MGPECAVEEETKKGVACDLCGRPRTRGDGGRIYSFTGVSWIKVHGRCLSWMGLKLSTLEADEREKKSKPKLRLVRAGRDVDGSIGTNRG